MDKQFDFLNSKVNVDILNFLADNAGRSDNIDEGSINLIKHIVKKTGYSRKGVYDALKKLEKENLVVFRKIGKSKLYKINNNNPVVKQFKVLKTVIELNLLIGKLQEYSTKIILYGSTARGDDVFGSDIDLLILGEKINQEDIKRETDKFKLKKIINAELLTPFEYEALKKKNPVYYSETDGGIILWEDINEQTV